MISFINVSLAVGTVLAQVFALVLIVSLLVKNETAEKIKNFFGTHAPTFAFVFTLVALLGSLFYSEIALYEPCKLCWFQRILIYPQALLLLCALWWKDRTILRYTQILSAIGLPLAVYHYLLQIGLAPSVACSTVGYSADCAKMFVMQFGYITIPMMAATVLLLSFLFSTLGKRYTQ